MQQTNLDEHIQHKFAERQRHFVQQKANVPTLAREIEQLEAELVVAKAERDAAYQELQRLRKTVRRPPPVDVAILNRVFSLESAIKQKQKELTKLEEGHEELDFWLNVAQLMNQQRNPPPPPPINIDYGIRVHEGERVSSDDDDWVPRMDNDDDDQNNRDDCWDEDWEPLDPLVSMPNFNVPSLPPLNVPTLPEPIVMPMPAAVPGAPSAKRVSAPSAPAPMAKRRRAVRVSDFIDVDGTQNAHAARQLLNVLEGNSVPHNVVRLSGVDSATSTRCSCGGELRLESDSAKSYLVCPQCSNVQLLDSRDGKRQTGEPINRCDRWLSVTAADRERTVIVHQYTYKRINHFKDWLSQFQAKEHTEIPPEVLDKVRVTLHQRHKRKLNNIRPKEIERILKDLRLPSWYEHKNLICNKISGNPPPFLSLEEERKLQQMFTALQKPFEKHKPRKRKNFLSYAYTLRKLLQILGFPESVWSQFKLLQGRGKLADHDEAWRKMMAELNSEKALGISWTYHASS